MSSILIQQDFRLETEDDTIVLAKKLAKEYLKKGLKIGVDGDLGAGKTFFAKHFFEDFLEDGEFVKSPSFTIMNEYYTKRGLSVLHLDLYRVNSFEELEGTGFYDYINSEDSIMYIEWYNNLDLIPYYNKNWIFLEIDIIADTTRKLILKRYE